MSAVCAHCGAPDPIRGDGGMTLACARCVASLARVAGDPASAHPEVLAKLLAVSRDVVHLDTRIVIDMREPLATPTVAPVWHWNSRWPQSGDVSLVRGGEA